MPTRREFLKLVCLSPFLDLAQFAPPTPTERLPPPTPPEPQPWQFPLTFPAYFVKERPQHDTNRHKAYLPLTR